MGRSLTQRLDAASLRAGCGYLAANDPRLRGLFEKNGVPPLRLRPEGFATLVHLILQQQVSRASAQAVFDRLEHRIGGTVAAESLLAVDPAELRECGFSYQKIEYVTEIARKVVAGALDLAHLGGLADGAAIAELTAQRGVGPWTASVYVLTALGRPDVWAPGDRALLVSLGRLLGRPDVPANDEAVAIAAQWSPWRAVAARLLWHDYSANELR